MKSFRDYLNEEYEEGDTERLIRSIKDPRKKKMVTFYYKKMIRDEMPEDLIYDNVKELIEKGIQALAQRTEFDNVEREDDDDDLDEDPKEVLNSIKNREIKRMAQMYYNGMKRDGAPSSAILDMMKDFKNETFWDIPDEIKTPKKENKVSPPKSVKDLKGKLKADISIGDYEKYLKEKNIKGVEIKDGKLQLTNETKEKIKKDFSPENKDAALKGNPREVNASYHIRGNNDKMTKEQQFKEKVNMILRGIKGYRAKTEKDKEKEKKLYDFEDLKEEYIKGTSLKTAALKVKKVIDRFPKKNYIGVCRQVADEFNLNTSDVIAAYKRLVR
jgi:hypothetical protein